MNHQLVRRGRPQKGHDTPDSTASREPCAVVGHGPVDGLGLLGNSPQTKSSVAGFHVTKEQAGPDFVHVVAKPLISIQNIHQLFNRRNSPPKLDGCPAESSSLLRSSFISKILT